MKIQNTYLFREKKKQNTQTQSLKRKNCLLLTRSAVAANKFNFHTFRTHICEAEVAGKTTSNSFFSSLILIGNCVKQ